MTVLSRLPQQPLWSKILLVKDVNTAPDASVSFRQRRQHLQHFQLRRRQIVEITSFEMPMPLYKALFHVHFSLKKDKLSLK